MVVLVGRFVCVVLLAICFVDCLMTCCASSSFAFAFCCCLLLVVVCCLLFCEYNVLVTCLVFVSWWCWFWDVLDLRLFLVYY